MIVGLIGNKRVGKSSIIKVVFQKLSPNETLFLEGTTRPEEVQVRNNPYLQFKIIDFPGSLDIASMSSQERKHLQHCSILIYVLDAQDQPYNKSLEKLINIFSEVYAMNPDCHFEVFIHKIDGDMYASDDDKTEVHNEVSDAVRIEANEKSITEPSFHLTSIYDLSIYEAFSKVLQKVTPQATYLQNILDFLVNNCNMDKVYLFDVITKLYVATDSSPVDMISYELCSDMIDLVIDISCIYGIENNESYNEAFNHKSTSVIKLDTGLTLYLREIDMLLALVCLVKEDDFDRQGLIDYNIDCFRHGAKKIFEARERWLREQEENKS